MHACTTQKYFEQTWSTSEVAIPRCALTCFHVESITRVSRRAPFQVKEGAIEMRSSFHDISLVGMSVEHSREVRFV
jgi:hypothetical protein